MARALNHFIDYQCRCLANQVATTVYTPCADFVELVAFLTCQVRMLTGACPEYQSVNPGIGSTTIIAAPPMARSS